ncbi:hypothetical protein RHO14_03400 [Orbus wheelerorum]|uniref:phage tail tube protein n=1 Tax=Orbus wheelerorum TaxID=3074111 RepID=UPI00370DB6B9
MTSKYTLTKGSRLEVTKDASNTTVPEGATWLELGCLLTEVSYTGGAKSDIEVTTLCSTEKEQTNGLPDPGEITLSGNWVPNDDALNVLRDAYTNDTAHAFRLVLQDKRGYAFVGEVRQESFTVSTDAVLTGEFTIRMKGRLENYQEK